MLQISGVILDTGEILNQNLVSFLPFGSETLIKRQVSEMKKICNEVILVTNQPQHFLPIFGGEIRIITGYQKGSGVVSGLHAAFNLAKNEHLWVVMSDMPFLSARVVKCIWNEIVNPEVDLIAPEWKGGIQLFHSIYNRECRKVTKLLVEEKQYSIMNLIERINFKVVEGKIFHDCHIFEPFPFRIQTKEDYEKGVKVERGYQKIKIQSVLKQTEEV